MVNKNKRDYSKMPIRIGETEVYLNTKIIIDSMPELSIPEEIKANPELTPEEYLAYFMETSIHVSGVPREFLAPNYHKEVATDEEDQGDPLVITAVIVEDIGEAVYTDLSANSIKKFSISASMPYEDLSDFYDENFANSEEESEIQFVQMFRKFIASKTDQELVEILDVDATEIKPRRKNKRRAYNWSGPFS